MMNLFGGYADKQLLESKITIESICVISNSDLELWNFV